MDQKRRHVGLGALAGAVGTVTLLGAAGLTVVYAGVYDVAATEEHGALVRWAAETAYHRSVERGAEGVVAPEAVTTAEFEEGAASYKAMCQQCHGGPGAERAEWASGMRPRPPYLVEAAAEWEPEEVFWILQHGIKMSGMPALGPTHDDETLWAITAFVEELPAMTPERYAALGASQGGHGGSGAHGGADEAHGAGESGQEEE